MKPPFGIIEEDLGRAFMCTKDKNVQRLHLLEENFLKICTVIFFKKEIKYNSRRKSTEKEC